MLPEFEVRCTSRKFLAEPDGFGPKIDWFARRRPAAQTDSAGPDSAHAVRALSTRNTRITPPRNIVKFADRLQYLLQPPLEQLLAAASLPLPQTPFPYQWEGIAYLLPRDEAVLADEMGLGKTMQAAVAMRALAFQGQLRRALLVSPKPLTTNWLRELAHWAPELPVTLVEGDQAAREWLWRRAEQGVLVVNYELAVRDRQLAAAGEPFDLVLIDEAQRIKNPGSATNQAICSLPRRRSWALTGTPIENSVDDLAGIFAFVSPGRVRQQMRTADVRTAVEDHVLRRTKDAVLADLPPKMIRDAELPLTDEQFASYRRAEEDGVVRLSEMGTELTIQHVFELVLRLKQICNFDPATGASAKFEQLAADLDECTASGRKAIVFSQWVETIGELAKRLERYNPLEFHGRVPSARRDGVIQEFKTNPDRHVLLMSYGAGSVGLNLQFAEYVFLFDRWWNPAVEDQAINRAHRIGVAGPVTVTRFLSVGTIEERIHRVLEEKRELFDAVFGGPDERGKRGLSRNEVFGLFNLPAA
ncbi:MAG: DEAD/DEAH box helicase [Pirellulales bacterium]|nr:DEAD/DEAH box helicase [Pirellulales bacterium]